MIGNHDGEIGEVLKTVLRLAAATEAATGIALVAYPPIVIRLLFGADVAGVTEVLCRFAGIALIALGLACWPNGSGPSRSSLHGMLVYGTLAALYLIVVGLGGEFAGVLLWPAVAAHAILVALLLRARFRGKPSGAGGSDT